MEIKSKFFLLVFFVFFVASLSGCEKTPPPPPVTLTILTSPDLPHATVGKAYSVKLRATNIGLPLTWTGTPPAGLSLNSSSGVISGTPDMAGAFSFDVTVSNSAKPPASDTKTFTLVVEPGDIPIPPRVVSVAPAQGVPGDTTNVTINGSNFQAGATSNFGAGITVNATDFVSSTWLTAAITIAGNAAVGPRTVTVTNPDAQTDRLANGFDVRVVPLRPPVLANVSPNNGEQGQTLTVTINGSDFQNGATSNFGAGITVNATNFVSATRLTAGITIAGNAAVGPRTVTVTNPDAQTDRLANGFDVRMPIHRIDIAGINMVINWEANIDGNPVNPANDNRVTITVRPGDQIVWRVRNLTHGVVFESRPQMDLFLDIEASQQLSTQAGFFGGNGFGTSPAGFPSDTELVRATIRAVPQGQELDFTCSVHGGPAGLMNGTLRIE